MNLTLYDFLKYYTNADINDIKLEMDLSEAQKMLKNFNNLKQEEFNKFDNSKGYKVEIYGDLKLTGFDPINVISLTNKMLHKHFISFNNYYFIKGKIVSSYSSEIWNINKIEFFVDKKPKLLNDRIYIDGIGEIEGKVKEGETTYIIRL